MYRSQHIFIPIECSRLGTHSARLAREIHQNLRHSLWFMTIFYICYTCSIQKRSKDVLKLEKWDKLKNMRPNMKWSLNLTGANTKWRFKDLEQVHKSAVVIYSSQNNQHVLPADPYRRHCHPGSRKKLEGAQRSKDRRHSKAIKSSWHFVEQLTA